MRYLRTTIVLLGAAVLLPAITATTAVAADLSEGINEALNKIRKVVHDAAMQTDRIDSQIAEQTDAVSRARQDWELGTHPDDVDRALTGVEQNLDSIDEQIGDVGQQLSGARVRLERLLVMASRLRDRQLAGAIKDMLNQVDAQFGQVEQVKKKSSSVREEIDRLRRDMRNGR